MPQDYAQAQAWFEKAAAQNDPRAQYELGVLYLEGKGVKQDYTQAQTWFDKAALREKLAPNTNSGSCMPRAKE